MRHANAKQLRSLAPLLNEWTNTVSYYSKHDWGDASWLFGERPMLGLLAASAWRLRGWIALEEFAIDRLHVVQKGRKGRKGRKGSPDTKFGRCDLFLAKATKSYAIEAKRRVVLVQPESDTAFSHIEKARSEAVSDAKKLADDEGDFRLAITFVVPRILAKSVVSSTDGKPSKAKTTKVLTEWLEHFGPRGKVSADAIAWSFPDQSRTHSEEEIPKSLYPGVLMLVDKIA